MWPAQPINKPSASITRTTPICPRISSTPLTLLLRHTNGPAPPARRLTVLTPDPQAPVVPQSTVSADLLQSLEILAELAVHAVGQNLAVLAVHNVALTVEEPGRDLVLGRVLDDRHDALEFFRSELAGAVSGVSMVCDGDDDGDGGIGRRCFGERTAC